MPNTKPSTTALESAFRADPIELDFSMFDLAPVVKHAPLRPVVVRRNGACCDLAVRAACVCIVAWKCSRHGDTHIGSHE